MHRDRNGARRPHAVGAAPRSCDDQLSLATLTAHICLLFGAYHVVATPYASNQPKIASPRNEPVVFLKPHSVSLPPTTHASAGYGCINLLKCQADLRPVFLWLLAAFFKYLSSWVTPSLNVDPRGVVHAASKRL
jgi:hypothetical protein